MTVTKRSFSVAGSLFKALTLELNPRLLFLCAGVVGVFVGSALWRAD